MQQLTLGEFLRTMRDDRDLRLRDVSEGAGKTEASLSRLERGKTDPFTSTLVAIVDYLRSVKELTPKEKDYLIAHTKLGRSYCFNTIQGGLSTQWIMENRPQDARKYLRHVADELAYHLGAENALDAILTLARQRGVHISREFDG